MVIFVKEDEILWDHWWFLRCRKNEFCLELLPPPKNYHQECSICAEIPRFLYHFQLSLLFSSFFWQRNVPPYQETSMTFQVFKTNSKFGMFLWCCQHLHSRWWQATGFPEKYLQNSTQMHARNGRSDDC